MSEEMNMLHEMLNGRLPCSALECELVQFAEQQAAENEALRQERDQLKAKLSREEGQHMNTVDQRDMTEQFADRLSSGIAEALGIEIGEHSSANNPWAEAITAIEEFDIAVHDAEVIENLKFPTMFRKMWSGSEVQAWLEEEANLIRQQAKEMK
jgi:type II secretory pathway component PulF